MHKDNIQSATKYTNIINNYVNPFFSVPTVTLRLRILSQALYLKHFLSSPLHPLPVIPVQSSCIFLAGEHEHSHFIIPWPHWTLRAFLVWLEVQRQEARLSQPITSWFFLKSPRCLDRSPYWSFSQLLRLHSLFLSDAEVEEPPSRRKAHWASSMAVMLSFTWRSSSLLLPFLLGELGEQNWELTVCSLQLRDEVKYESEQNHAHPQCVRNNLSPRCQCSCSES